MENENNYATSKEMSIKKSKRKKTVKKNKKVEQFKRDLRISLLTMLLLMSACALLMIVVNDSEAPLVEVHLHLEGVNNDIIEGKIEPDEAKEGQDDTEPISEANEAENTNNVAVASYSGGSVEDQIRQIAAEENFQWVDYLVRLADCESKFIVDERHQNSDKYNSIDRGLFQINDYWHPEVSDECCDDVDCSTRWTIDMIKAGQQHQWSCDDII